MQRPGIAGDLMVPDPEKSRKTGKALRKAMSYIISKLFATWLMEYHWESGLQDPDKGGKGEKVM